MLRGLYLFASSKRKTDLGSCLRRCCKKYHLKVKLDEIDLLRGGEKHNMLSPRRWRDLVSLIKKGKYDVVVASPPCGTFSRARWRTGGPKPLRLRHCPRGMPWLRGRRRASVLQANALVDLAAEALHEQYARAPDTMGLLEHPEDLGAIGSAHPGSSWQFENVQALNLYEGVVSGAISQDTWGRPYPKPTRFQGRLPGLTEVLHVGEPTFDTDGKYTGPLPRRTPSSQSMPVGRGEGRSFLTAPSAAWPPKLCEHFANLITDNFIRGGFGEALKVGKETAASTDLPTMPIAITPSSIESGPGLNRRKITPEELSILKDGGSIAAVYIGRGGRGAPASKWGNPYHLGRDGNRFEVTESFRKHLHDKNLVPVAAEELWGKTLVCHCPEDLRCHGDIIIEEVHKERRAEAKEPKMDPVEPANAETAWAAKAVRRPPTGRLPAPIPPPTTIMTAAAVVTVSVVDGVGEDQT